MVNNISQTKEINQHFESESRLNCYLIQRKDNDDKDVERERERKS